MTTAPEPPGTWRRSVRVTAKRMAVVWAVPVFGIPLLGQVSEPSSDGTPYQGPWGMIPWLALGFGIYAFGFLGVVDHLLARRGPQAVAIGHAVPPALVIAGTTIANLDDSGVILPGIMLVVILPLATACGALLLGLIPGSFAPGVNLGLGPSTR